MSKTAAVVLALLSLLLFPTASKAQLIQSGNVYAGVAYADSVDVINRLTFRGFDGSVEVKPSLRFSYLGFVLDGSGIYRPGVVQYNAGTRLPDFQELRKMARVRARDGGRATYHNRRRKLQYLSSKTLAPGRTVRIPFKRFSWRFQLDVVHSHLLDANQNDVRGSTGLVWRF